MSARSFEISEMYMPRRLPSKLMFAAVAFLAGTGCSSRDATGPEQSDHVIGATVLLYAQTGNNAAIVEAEVLLDGVKKGPSQRIVNGTFQYWLEFQEPLKSGGSHRVGIRIVEQKYSTVEYLIGGTAYGARGSTQSIVQVSFPSSATLKRGDVVEVRVDVP
jgi:hypothetical protein